MQKKKWKVKKKNGAALLIEALVHGGVEIMFANPGTTEMVLVEALDKVEGMQGVLCAHETVCSGAADGYARMTGKTACTLLHLGVGLANATANLHNAKRASTPVINLVGDMATWHLDKDPVLASDITSLAHFTTPHVFTCDEIDNVRSTVTNALMAIRDFCAGESRIATLIIPHDVQRNIVSEDKSYCTTKKEDDDDSGKTLFERAIEVHNRDFNGNDAIPKLLTQCAHALTDTSKKVALLIGGTGAYDEKALKALKNMQISNPKLKLLIENSFVRVDRGVSNLRPCFERVPYFPNDAARFFAGLDTLIICGARKPVAMFGYQDGISNVVPDSIECLEIDASDVTGAILYLYDKFIALSPLPESAQSIATPRTKIVDSFATNTNKLTARDLCAVIATRQPENAIIVDESLTSGGAYWDLSMNSPPFTHLTLTGGSIGIGPALSVGCAVACPTRRVINFQADGSALYSTPALWTQASEHLDITTIICANHSYQILRLEQQKQSLNLSKPFARKFTSLAQPPVDWVSIAQGYGIAARRVTTPAELNEALLLSLEQAGPYLIEAVLSS